MKKVTYKNMTWVDLPHPSDEDIAYLRENFDLHPLAIEEFSTPTYRPHATKYSNCLFLTIHIPLFDAKERTTYAGEIDILLTPTHVITGHRKDIFQMDNFMDMLQEKEGKRRMYMDKTPSHLLYNILSEMINSCFPRLDHITRNIDKIEASVFSGEESAMVREISIVKRDILNFRRTVMPQRAILESLVTQPGNVVAPDIKPYYQDLIGTNIRLWNMLESSKETISSLEETNNSLLSEKINNKMRVITLFSSIFIPMTLYANVLGINVKTPLSDHPLGFIIHLAVMVMISLSTIVMFKLIKWL